MATVLTKKTKPRAEYQQWTVSGVSNSSGVVAGDIIGIEESIGRAANSITIESIGGETTLRFNVSKKIFKPHGGLHESWIGLGHGSPRQSPLLVGEIEEVTPLIKVESGDTQTWLSSEVSVRDIKLVTIPSGLKITTT